jgi:SNF2 family DNA or RNA helicase
MQNYEVLTPQLVDTIEESESDQQWLFLDESDEYQGCWQVDGLSQEYFFDFEEIIGPHRLLTPIKLQEFMDICEWGEYRPVFMEDPLHITEFYEHLLEEPNVSLRSNMERSDEHGFLPWQVVGFNKLIRSDVPAGYVVWDTGAGKSAFIAAAIEYHRTHGHPFDLALVVVKSHNKFDTKRKIEQMIDVEPIILEASSIDKRLDIYEQILEDLAKGKKVVAVLNYEKLRDDEEFFKLMVKKRDVLFFWDEMPTKLSNQDTKLYKAVKRIIYKSFYSKPNVKWQRHWALTATPIENSPYDVFSCIHLMQPGLMGSNAEFQITHVAGYNPLSGKPTHWKNLDLIEAKLAHMTHRVSKQDPQVAEMFADTPPMEKYIDWNPSHKKLYDKLTGKAADLLEELEDANILSMIQIMQMVCDAPSMVLASADNRDWFDEQIEAGIKIPVGTRGSDIAQILTANIPKAAFSNKGHTKIEAWYEIIDKHADSKILTFSSWGSYIFPVWEDLLQKWGISYVLFNGTSKQKQTALDRFRDDPSIRVFLSGDAGADSIDIPQANVVVHYNNPWKWTTRKQRLGRADRVNSNYELIYEYSLELPDSVDLRKRAIIDRKHGYHEMIFDGRAIDEANSASLTKADLIYMLTGITSDQNPD